MTLRARSGHRPNLASLAALTLALLVGLVAALHAPAARAHQTALAVMAVTELQPGRFSLRWDNAPVTDEGAAVRVAAIWPPHCTEAWPVLDCGAEGLVGRIGFDGLGVAQSAAMLRIRSLAGATQVIMLTPSAPVGRAVPNFDPDSWAGRADIASSYVAIGIEHILIGIDHLLFVLGLIWIAGAGWPLVKTITAFTVAHSLTLGAVTFGWVGVPEGFVNAMIALSIVFVGVEIMRRERGLSSVALRRPWLVAFAFGLLHGFGFANALLELGLPEGAALLALAAFNIGVEIGQLAFVGLALALAWAWTSMAAPLPRRVAPPAAYAIGGVAAFWFVDRAAALMGA